MFVLLSLLACGGSSSTPPTAAAADDLSGQPVVRWKGGSLTMAEIEAPVKGKLASMEQEYQLERYDLLSRSMNAAIDDALLKAEAERRGMEGVEPLLREEIEQKIQPPDEATLQAFYEEVKPQLRGAPFEAVQQMLGNEWMQRQMAQRYESLVEGLRKGADIQGGVPYPEMKRIEVPLVDTDPTRGPDDAPVTIVQFAEYQCYFCAKVQPTLDALLEDYDGKVRLVYKDFPLENHQRALPAAVAARCAGEQDAYWKLSSRMLDDQSALSDADLRGHVEALGLDVDAWQQCVDSGEMQPLVRAGFQAGQDAGVAATPTFYVNGLLVSGAQPYDTFKAIIEQELAR